MTSSKPRPTLFDVRQAVAENPDANHQAKQAIVDAIDPVLLSIGDVLRYRVGWTTHDLAKMHLIFEFGGIAEVEKDLLLNGLVLSEFTSRIARGVSGKMSLWISCDEAARLVSGLGGR